jgi:ribosomal protein S18 acetylase RimI-like enzyme
MAVRKDTSFEFGPLKEKDLPSALRLQARAEWNQTERDWRRVMELNASGCFAAFAGRKVVGTITTATYGKDLAWIGMVIVDADYRRQGIATRLVRLALEQQQGRANTIKLDATPEGRPVYESLGFIPESIIERWEGPAIAATATEVVKFDQRLRDDVFAMDRLAFGADRSRLLSSLLEDACCDPLVSIESAVGQPRGYALARSGARALYVGPLIASDETVAAALLDGMLEQLAGQKVYIDLNAGFAGGRNVLAARRFAKQRDLIRMRYGGESAAGTSNLVFASAGPELG